jgi:hypothetical protein
MEIKLYIIKIKKKDELSPSQYSRKSDHIFSDKTHCAVLLPLQIGLPHQATMIHLQNTRTLSILIKATLITGFLSRPLQLA